ncbi:putative F-box containing protein [Tokyovirus A1]|nr:putative F-box containing protein [Tokyovirus A1]BAU80337.1 putative F-box containing protein [Tokyovirus A1]
MQYLPNEITQHVFSFLSLGDLLNFCALCCWDDP